MDNKEWYDCGEKIVDIVNDAVNSNNFKQLNKELTSALNDTLDAVQRSMDERFSMQKQAQEAVRSGSSWTREGNLYRERTEQKTGRIQKRLDRSLKGAVQTFFGYFLGASNAFLAILLMLPVLTGDGLDLILPALMFGGISWFSFRWGRKGKRLREMEARAAQYLNAMGSKDSITVKELAAATGRTQSVVKEDLKMMIDQGVFNGTVYLDPQGTSFMTSREAYTQYEAAMKAYRQRKAQEKKAAKEAKSVKETAPSRQQQEQIRKEAEKSMASYSDETRRILEEGNAYIQHIHASNVIIKDEEMSEKLDRLENVVTRIFEQVAADPDSAPDLHRMMTYYLPTTQKLLDAYVAMDKQRVKGQNITATMQEIEASLDTINSALEVFLDDFFQDEAWDIQADIATLQTMMARDGLTGSDFTAPGDHVKSAARDLTGKGRSSAAAMEEEMKE